MDTGLPLTVQDMLATWRIKPRSTPLKGDLPPTIAHEKLDGWRLTFCRGFTGEAEAWTRTTNVSEVIRGSWFAAILNKLPIGSMIDCELTVPHCNASAVSSLLAGNDPNGKGGLTRPTGAAITVFAIPFWKGQSRYRDTMLMQKRLAGSFFRACRLPHKSATFARWWKTLVMEQGEGGGYTRRQMTDIELKELLVDILERDRRNGRSAIEGFVLKAGPFAAWSKFKPTKTVDLVCTGLEPGEGKYVGMVGAVKGSVVKEWDILENRCSQYHEVASCSGMSDALRSEISEKDIGRVFECQYQLVGDGGRLRHPQFIRWRDDKAASECTGEQLGEYADEGGAS